MISLVFMTDPARVIGGSTKLRNMLRMPMLPVSELAPAMEKIMSGEHIVIGSKSMAFYSDRAHSVKKAYVYCRNFKPAYQKKGFTHCSDIDALAQEYQQSEDELLVLGGLETWRKFLPYANRLKIAETHKNVPGDLVFNEWDNGDFELTDTEKGKKLDVKIYQRVNGGKQA